MSLQPEGQSAYRCGVCNRAFPDHAATWRHLTAEHPELPRGEVVTQIIAPPEPPAAPRSNADSAQGRRIVPAALRLNPHPPAFLIAHWYHLIEGLQASSLGFYQELERALARRAIPEATPMRVDYREAGLLSAKREYLHITR